jgi:hypothetical protein
MKMVSEPGAVATFGVRRQSVSGDGALDPALIALNLFSEPLRIRKRLLHPKRRRR